MNTYEEYLNHSKGNILKIEDAMNIYVKMMKSIETSTQEYKIDLWHDYIEQAIKYVGIRANWEIMSREEQIEIDEQRTITHNTLISRTDALARNLGSDGTDVSWREDLGENRTRIGDFACFVIYMTGISNR